MVNISFNLHIITSSNYSYISFDKFSRPSRSVKRQHFMDYNREGLVLETFGRDVLQQSPAGVASQHAAVKMRCGLRQDFGLAAKLTIPLL